MKLLLSGESVNPDVEYEQVGIDQFLEILFLYIDAIFPVLAAEIVEQAVEICRLLQRPLLLGLQLNNITSLGKHIGPVEEVGLI